MAGEINRRGVIKSTAALGAAWAASGSDWLRHVPPVSAAEAAANPRLVRLDSGIEPLVQLVEQTPRESLLEAVAARIRRGATYQEMLAALQLATVRNVQPRPAVGFKFHAVLVVNAAHLVSLASPDAERWLPIFWAFDYFKRQQAEEEKVSGWKLGPTDEARVAAPQEARSALTRALDTWDEAAADGAAAGLARSAGTHEIFETLFRYGARDFRAIGHKAIFVANAQRTLAAIGHQHTEPIVRSLVFALLNHQGESNPAQNDLAPDRPWRHNLELAAKFRTDWLAGATNEAATKELVTTFRQGSADDAARTAADIVNRGIGPQSVWDAVFLASGELLMRQPGIIGLHTLTASNALRYAYDTSADDETRRLVLLQACSFLPLFRQSAQGRGALRDATIDSIQPIDVAGKDSTEQLSDVFAEVSRDRQQAAGKTLAYLNAGGDPLELIHTARRLVFLKGDDAHDYKFSSAVLEDCGKLSAPWRNRFLALSVFNLKGSGQRDNPLVERTRAALRG